MIAGMQCQRALDHLALARHAGLVQTRSRTREPARFAGQQRAGQRGGRGRVADAHLAADEQGGLLLVRTQHTVAPSPHGLLACIGAHCRALGEIRGTRA